MDVLLATTGSAGDVYPFLALGQALRARGHQISLLAPAEFQGLSRRLGIDFAALEREPCPARPAFSKVMHSVMHPFTSHWRKLARASTVVPLIRPLYDAIAHHAERRNAVVVASAPLLGARVAHDRLNVPLVTVHVSPSALRSANDAACQASGRVPSWLPPLRKRASYRLLDALIFDPLLGRPINRLRAELGLPSVHRVLHDWRHSPQLGIGLFPEWFAPPQPDWPAALRLTGFLFDDTATTADLSPAIESFLRAGPPPIICTPGSAIRTANTFFEESIRACVHLKRRALLFTPHRQQIPASLPAGIRHFEYAPFRHVLGRASALIHTGGIGTAAQALSASIPQIIMPIKNDQPDNAGRLERLGVARTIPGGVFRAERVAHALAELLACPKVAERCRLFAARLASADPLAETCQLIERLTRNGQQAKACG